MHSPVTHTHDHSHHHGIVASQINTAFIIGIALNAVFVIVEIVAGLTIHSLALLSDAGHNLADVASLSLSLFAFKLANVKPTEKFTYGFRKTSILAALFNAMVLLLSIGIIGYEAIMRLIEPAPVPGKTIAFIALIGIVINGGTALLFFRKKEQDLNIKSAYLHLLSDALVSFVLVFGGIIIYYTGWFRIDSILGIAVALVILLNTWRLLKSSLRLSLDGVPEGIDLSKVRNAVTKIPGVSSIHHIHVWAMSTSENALTAHILLDQEISIEQESQIKSNIKHELEHLNISHATLEVERSVSNDSSCNPLTV